MKRIVLHVIISIFGIVIGWAANSFFHSIEMSVAPSERPKLVPASAAWVGGDDGGVWVDCLAAADAKLKCKIFSDVTGEILEDNYFSFNISNLKIKFYSDGILDAQIRYDSED